MASTNPPQPRIIKASITSETTHLVQPWPTPSSSPHPPPPPPRTPQPSAHPLETPPHHIRISVSQSTSITSLPRDQPHEWPRGPCIDIISQDMEMQDIPLDDGQPSEWAAREARAKQRKRGNRCGWVRKEGKLGKGGKVTTAMAVVLLVALVVVVVVIGVTGVSH